jgi:hypothetical protein
MAKYFLIKHLDKSIIELEFIAIKIYFNYRTNSFLLNQIMKHFKCFGLLKESLFKTFKNSLLFQKLIFTLV